MDRPLLDIRNLTVEAFQPESGWRTVVRDVSFEVRPGEIVALIGESGGGKTTVGLSALGYARPGMRFAKGEVLFKGENILTFSAKQLRLFRGSKVAYIAQSAAAALNPSMTIGDQIAEGVVQHGLMNRTDAAKLSQTLLRALKLPKPAELGKRYPQETSGGQQQRIMTAMALSCNPELLVLDEPTTALDVTTQIQVLKTIKEALSDFNASAIYVSHDLAVVSQIATRIIVLRNGQIVEEGPTFEVLKQPRNSYTASLVSAVRRVPSADEVRETRDVARTAPVVSVRNIVASYERPRLFRRPSKLKPVLHGVSLDIYPGEVLAVVGESGSGKSTLARVIAGLHAPAGGGVLFDGEIVAPRAKKRTRECLRAIQIVFQSPEQALNPRVTVEQAISRPLAFYFGMDTSARRTRVAELLEMVGLPSSAAGKSPTELSGGQRQRVAIARALAAKPRVILCDEFLSALDTIVAAKIVDLMRSLRDRLGTAYVFISHDLATVSALADRIAVMQHGRIVDLGKTDRIFRSGKHAYTSQLIRSVPELKPGWLEAAVAAK